MPLKQRIATCLWFDSQAEQAAAYYISIFKNSRIVNVSRYTEAGREIHQRPAGSVMTVTFELDGQSFTALNGGPLFKFNEAVSLQIYVEDQKELDHYWSKLTPGGDPKSHVCGWLKDRYGLSWQVVPRKMVEWMGDPNEKSERVMTALLKMGKLDIAALERAYEGR